MTIEEKANKYSLEKWIGIHDSLDEEMHCQEDFEAGARWARKELAKLADISWDDVVSYAQEGDKPSKTIREWGK